MRKPWVYKSVNIFPADINSSGIRWYARLAGNILKADSKQEMKSLINQYKQI